MKTTPLPIALLTVLCLAAGRAHAVDVWADTSMTTFNVGSIIVPVEDFSFDGSDDILRVLFTQPVEVAYSGPGSALTSANLQADSDGAGDGTFHGGDLSSVLGTGLALLPDYTDAGGNHSDSSGGQLNINFNLDNISPGDGYTAVLYGVYFDAGQNFDPANLTNGEVRLFAFNYNGETETSATFTVLVPEPASALVMMLGGLFVVSRRNSQSRFNPTSGKEI